MTGAYYNEFDPKAAAWLKQLIKNGLIADGEVDERSITEVNANDLRGFKQKHFFAGIGGWSYALRLAGWTDDRPVCTASLPCQPFSVAGQQRGKDDERHLLPHFIELVKQCNFTTIFGEQVPGAIKHGWLDDLYDEMERENYAVGSIVLTAAGIGAPHIRQRLYWVANAIHNSNKRSVGGIDVETNSRPIGDRKSVIITRESGGTSSNVCGMADSKSSGRWGIQGQEWGKKNEWDKSNPEWLYCRDNKFRPIKPGIKPLVDGVSERMVRIGNTSESIDADHTQEARVMRLKGYGNAIVPQVAASFISAFMSVNGVYWQ